MYTDSIQKVFTSCEMSITDGRLIVEFKKEQRISSISVIAKIHQWLVPLQ
jgi:hypothetical protein